jgi:hypothetical protein
MLCCLFIVMLENAGDDLVETKLSFVDHKVSMKKLKHEATRSKKCGCMFMLRGYVNMLIGN